MNLEVSNLVGRISQTALCVVCKEKNCKDCLDKLVSQLPEETKADKTLKQDIIKHTEEFIQANL